MPSNGSEPAGLVVTDRLTIPFDELVLRATTSGGPGGQHANRSRTRVEVTFDVMASAALTDEQRARLLDRLGPLVTAASGDERSQRRNRDAAIARLRLRLVDALHVDPARRPTRPSRASVHRRLDAKRRASVRKADRRTPPPD